ncbi:MAG: HAD-IC family P-type ATPase [Bacilli bacterium]|nr:HAD-IC family P-type ATPase [Bacilli bacterium]
MVSKSRKHDHLDPIDIDLNVGLTDKEVKIRQDKGLVNKISKNVTKSYGRIIFDNVFNFFNIILFAIAIFMIIVGAEPRKFFFAYILIANIGIGIYQDVKARRQVDKLRVVSYPTVNVLRNGATIEIPANEIVLHDIVILKTGNQIIADGTVLSGNIEVNESLLTGESNNILKQVGDQVYSGSYLTSGMAKVRVDKVGKANYAETLQSKAKQFKRPKSEILKTINTIFKILGVAVVVIGIATAVTYWLEGKFEWPGMQNMVDSDFRDSALKLSASITSMMPVGMYLFVSMTLAVGVIRLAKHRVLVQELYCLEMLARVDVLCLDKTGTITDGTMNVKRIDFLGEKPQYDIENVLLTLVSATGDQNATAVAIQNTFKDHEVLPFHMSLPFNSERKMSAVMLNDGRCFVLGAKEFLPVKHKDKLYEVCESYERQGLRVLVLAYSKKAFTFKEEMPEVKPVCVVVLEDHIKDDAIKNITWFKKNGVAIKVISGDNPISVSEIAKRVGVDDADKWISLEGMSLEEVKDIAHEFTVFGRVSPEQKEVIVESLQGHGHVVAMTGDGVNDILALKAADCSIAMASGSDAAKSVAHLVTMDSNFSSLPEVVAEGRRVINNLQRTCAVFLIKSFYIMFVAAVFLIASWATHGNVKYPYDVNMTNIWELITVGIACFFLSLQPNSEKTESTFMKNILTMVFPGLLTQMLAMVIIFSITWINPVFLPRETATTMAVISFTAISFMTIVFISMPFDVYRSVLCGAVGFLVVAFFLIDCFLYAPHNISDKNPTGSFFSLSYHSINNSNWYVLVLTIALVLPLYYGAMVLGRFLNKHAEEKRMKK